MPKVKISEYSATANSNTDVASINIDEGCAPSGINNAIRAVMGHLKDFQQGTNGDPFNGPVNGTLGATTANTAVVTTLNSTDATDASSTTAAAMKTAGGLGVAKKLFVGLDSNIYGLTVGRGAGAVASNTAVGASALAANSTGAQCTAVGSGALAANTVNYGTAFGFQALTANTTGAANAAFGTTALAANTTGAGNSAFGSFGFGLSDSPLQANTTGNYNSAFGLGALAKNTTASYNTAVGYQAGYSYNGTNGYNAVLGYQAGYTMAGGAGNYANCFIGAQAGFNANGTTSENLYNTFVGPFAGYYMQTGGKNTILGAYNGNQGGLDIRTASNYIVLSDGDGNPRGAFDNNGNFLINTTSQVLTSRVSTNFTGNNANGATFNDTGDGNGAGFIIFSESGTAIGSISRVASTSAVAFNTTSDYRLKTVTGAVTGQGERIDALKPIDYQWKDGGQNARGFLAHEFQAVYSNSVTGTKDAVDADGNPKHQSMQASSSEVIADLVAEIQSLRKRLASAGIT
jgi:hypothetical protein